MSLNILNVNFYPTHRVELKSPNKKLYESYYFRGTDNNGQTAFWLKHNLLKAKNTTDVLLENTFIFYPNSKEKPIVYKNQITLNWRQYLHLVLCCQSDWEHLLYRFDKNNFFQIKPNSLHGRIQIDDRWVEWDFKLKRSKEPYYHFSHPWYYKGFFPKKKILTHDMLIEYSGSIMTEQVELLDTQFIGMNGHNWGKEHAYHYAYANCNQWKQKNTNAYFDGFSAKILIGHIPSPALSLCSLMVDNRWYHFNHVSKSFRHKVKKMNSRTWVCIFKNEEHTLRVEIQSKSPSWASLPYFHPNKKISTVENTKFATGKLILKDKSKKTILTLESDLFELETLTP